MRTLFGAIDVGASSGRVIAGEFTGKELVLTEVYRFPNFSAEIDGRLVWDFENLLAEIRSGLQKLREKAQTLNLEIRSVGIDTWAVDYGLLANGKLLMQPNCYRDPLNLVGVDWVHSRVPFEELYRISGLQFLPFNSLYQLARQRTLDSKTLNQAEHIVMLPDLIGYFLTGKLKTERTNASSTGLLNAVTRDWDRDLAVKLEIDVDKFPELADAGDQLGQLKEDFGPGLAGVNVVLVGSHDTASAVVGVPSREPGFAFLSSGTWSLLGAEISEPVLSQSSMSANFTNELGVDGRVRFLKNLSGLWLLSEVIRDYELNGQNVDLAVLLDQVRHISPPQRIVVEDPDFVAPNQMVKKINNQLLNSGQQKAESIEELTAIILHSLAKSYAVGFAKLSDLTQRHFSEIHVIGGGVQNQLLCQLTANATKSRVYAGPVEATAIGNLMVQVRAAGLVGPELEDIRRVILDSGFEITEYLPQ